MRRAILAALLALAGAASAAEPVQPFVVGSLGQILAARQGKPFILAFWSISCVHCPTELKNLAALKRRHPAVEVVLVAADTFADALQTAQRAGAYGLAGAEQWVFADAMPERLRFDIDRRWYGELPRTHFYDAAHRVEVRTGVVEARFLDTWPARNGVAAGRRR